MMFHKLKIYEFSPLKINPVAIIFIKISKNKRPTINKSEYLKHILNEESGESKGSDSINKIIEHMIEITLKSINKLLFEILEHIFLKELSLEKQNKESPK